MNKKLLFNGLVLSFLALGFAKAQNIEFEDDVFKTLLLGTYIPAYEFAHAEDENGNSIVIDANHDGEISQAEALNVYQLEIPLLRTSAFDAAVTSLKGIEYFTNLTVLRCEGRGNALSSLDVSALTKLKELYCSPSLTTASEFALGVRPLSNLTLPKTPTLEVLDISNSSVNNLDFLSGVPNLKKLYMDNITLENINVSGFQHLEELSVTQRIPNVTITLSDLPELTTLNSGASMFLYRNELYLSYPDYYLSHPLNITLSLSNLPKITELKTQGKNITINNLPNLTKLDCSTFIYPADAYPCTVESLVLSGVPKLTEINANNHALKTLDLSNVPNLVTLLLWGRNNDWGNIDWTPTLENLDVSKNINLQAMNLSDNNISTLDVSKNINLKRLSLNGNNLKTLDVSYNINLVQLELGYGIASLYMKNGVKKTFAFGGAGGYYFSDNSEFEYYAFNAGNLNTLEFICCDEDEIDALKDFIKEINEEYSQTLNPTVTSDCEPYGLGTEDLSPQAKVTLYPNPVKDMLYFSASGKVAKAEIYDLNGRLIKTAAVSNNSVNVSSLSKGVYFIILHTDKGTVKEKFIKN